MRLKKLTVSGFKSFVDPIDIRLPGSLVGVVGPNGCGKSNVIDAVRWVMGEGSAKVMRGDQMTDVIFNGSASRKPVGKASVELVFDNQEGLAGGNYAKFAEISVRRTLSRDGESHYFVNNIKSRRKDVLDLFRGTGLGARSYSIIEQGMVGRIVEARPDELRAFVEEAAGTSRYKDRRRETEIRIRHTRENLERVEDIRDELEKHLRRLQRQSSAARRYKVLKEEERRVNGQLQVMRLQQLEAELEEQNLQSARFEKALEAAVSTQRGTETELEQLRRHQSERREENQETQQNFYTLGSEIRAMEQQIEHMRETRQRQGEEIERLRQGRGERQQEMEAGRRRQGEIESGLAEITPVLETLDSRLDESEGALREAEEVLSSWQQTWETFNQAVQQPVQQQEVQQSRISQLEQHLEQAALRRQRLREDLESVRLHASDSEIQALRDRVRRHDDVVDSRELKLQYNEQQLQAIRDDLSARREELGERRVRQQEAASRLDSLREIQAAALGGDDEELNRWLSGRFGGDAARLAWKVRVEEGWQRAVDRILNGFLGAVCLRTGTMPDFSGRPEGVMSVMLDRQVTSPPARQPGERLIDKVTAEGVDLTSLLADIYVADGLDQALAMQDSLLGRDCVVTRDGVVVGANWISFASESQLETGVLVREEEIKQLDTRVDAFKIEISNSEGHISRLESAREDAESGLQRQRTELNGLMAEKTALHNQLGREEARLLEAGQRSEQMIRDLGELESQIRQDHEQIDEARELLDQARGELGKLDSRRHELLSRRVSLEKEVARCRELVVSVRDEQQQKLLEKQRLDSSHEAVIEQLRRLGQQISDDDRRLGELSAGVVDGNTPEEDLSARLQTLLQDRVEVEQRYQAAQDEMAEIDNRLSALENRRRDEEQAVAREREALEGQRLGRQEVLVRRDTLAGEVSALALDRQALMADLPESAGVEEWDRSLEEIRHRVERIGPVNLVAIEEFEEQSQRKEYLDTQHSDLSEALETLESVIRKIDRETRSRFRDTFDRLNVGFNDFFPQLFGGGRAELQLTSDDLLTAGVTVMARPPGKRNSTIHLLSGGEKALTAVALLFSLFRLNPAPFCMLDEVDAPLDDANVDRYCNTLRKLCDASQMVVITHNKITMEAADVLVGVTMSEPGVSRMVTVDIDRAVEMAAQA